MFSTRCHLFIRSLLNIQNTVALQAASPTAPTKRELCTTKPLYENYYDSLGIEASSTQNEIKAAYYKLSMIYHPDKNQGSESAAKKFREITQAYEVLSNYRLRRLYDKGIIHTAGSQYAQTETSTPDMEDIVEDDPQTKFYKSRFSKSKVTQTQGGQTPIYDFDEWARAHYGKSFDRKKAAKERYDRKTAREVDHPISLKRDVSIFAIVLSCIVLYLIVYAEQSYDNPKNIKQKKEN